jgi:hypothetical protein
VVALFLLIVLMKSIKMFREAGEDHRTPRQYTARPGITT